MLVTADLAAEALQRVVDAVDPDAIQLSGDEPPSRARWLRPAGLEGAAASRPTDDRARTRSVALARTYLEAGAARILLDTAGGPHPGGTGVRVDAGLAAAVAREVPVDAGRRPARR